MCIPAIFYIQLQQKYLFNIGNLCVQYCLHRNTFTQHLVTPALLGCFQNTALLTAKTLVASQVPVKQYMEVNKHRQLLLLSKASGPHPSLFLLMRL